MADTELSAAEQLRQQHSHSHRVIVEDAPDEETGKTATGEAANGEPVSDAAAVDTPANEAGKPKASGSTSIDTQSHELFPELGPPKTKATAAAPIWGVKSQANGKTNGAGPANGDGTPRASTPASGISTPTAAGSHKPPTVKIPGHNYETLYLDPQHVLPRTQLKRPVPDIIKDLNRRSRANINMSTLGGGRLKFEATGPQEQAELALLELLQQIGSKQTITVPIPQSARAHIIGKGGSTIRALQEKSGARIQLPKLDEAPMADDEDDDSTIDVTVVGNAHSAAKARDGILKIVGERADNVSSKVRGIPSEFYPFIAGPNNSFVNKMEENNGVHVRIPPHQARSSQLPAVPADGQRPVFAPAHHDHHIQLAGSRAAVQAAKAEIERQAEELRQRLALKQLAIQRGRHQFIIGDRGIPLDQFFEETGCAIILPEDEDEDTVTVIGPADRLEDAYDRAVDLAMNMQMSNIDISRFHRQAPGGAAAHARNVTRYLRQRKEIERLERMHNVHFNTPFTDQGALPWELYAREGKNAIRAQSEIKGLVDGHPPARMATVDVDNFFHNYLRNEIKPRVRNDYRVHVVVPDASEGQGMPVLLVYEGPESPDTYQIPRVQPSQAETQEMQKWLRDARQHILDLVSQQEDIVTTPVEVPLKFHDKLKRFIKKEQANRPADQIPVRVSNIGTTVKFHGPRSATEALAQKCAAFVEQEKVDEKERGFTLDFEFPQKFANHLIGKGGSNIRELRERFDVDIKVQDGKVELKGPKAKAEVARSYIQTLGRQLADEATHILKIEPKFHRELIGAGGTQINRLQTRYKVLIFFPRTAKSSPDDESAEASSDNGKPKRQQAPDEVIVRGPKKGADEARDEILSLLQYLRDNSFTATVTMQQKQVPSLIGQGGSAMDDLRQLTGAKIDIPSSRDAPDGNVEIQIKGTKSQVAAAKKLLEEKKQVFDDTVTKTIEVDKKFHRALIGAGGSTLRDIVVKAGGSDDRRELSRAIQFPKQESDGNVIKVEGRSDVVNKIIAHIQSIVSELENQVTDVVEVPSDKHRMLIGRGGEVRRNLEAQFKVSIDVPRQGSGQTGVKITGQSADTAKAKAHIQELVKEQPGQTMQVPRNLHHAISNNGQIFRRLRNDFSVTLDHAGETVPSKPSAAASTRVNGGALPLITDDADSAADAHSWHVVEAGSTETGDIPWVLRGTPENVEKAQKIILAALEQSKSQTATGYLVLPDPRTYRHVIGQGGSKVNAIRKQSGCRINVPRDAKDEAIEVVGTKEGVEQAKELILQAVREGIDSRSPKERD